MWVQSSTLAPNARSSFDEAPASPLAQIGVRSSFVGCVIGDARSSWRRTPSRLSQAVPRLFACDLEPAPGQGRREEALPPTCRRRPRLPANPYTRRPAYAESVPMPCQYRSAPTPIRYTPATIVRFEKRRRPYIEQICVPKACQCRASAPQLDRKSVQRRPSANLDGTSGPRSSSVTADGAFAHRQDTRAAFLN